MHSVPFLTLGLPNTILTDRKIAKIITIAQRRLIRSVSLIFIARAERTRNTTEILKNKSGYLLDLSQTKTAFGV